MVSFKSSAGERAGPPAVIVGIHAVARMLGLSRPACHELVSAGIIRRKSFGKYDAIEVATDYVAHLKRQLIAARRGTPIGRVHGQVWQRSGQIARLERERLQGTLISLDLVQPAFDALGDLMRMRCMGLPRKCALSFSAALTPLKAEQIIERAVREVLDAIAATSGAALAEQILRKVGRFKGRNGHDDAQAEPR